MPEATLTTAILALIATVYTGLTQHLFIASLALTLWLTVILLLAYSAIFQIIKNNYKNDSKLTFRRL